MKRALFVAILGAMLVAGCTQSPDTASPSASSPFDKRAEKVARAWRAAGVNDAFVPIGELTQAPQNGFPSDELKMSFLEGRYVLSEPLPTESSKGTIRFPDGKRLEVPLLSAAEALRAIDRGDAGDGRVALVVTSAQAGTTPVRTSRGVAEVPSWRFTVKGIEHPVVQVSVSPEAIKPLPPPLAEPFNPADRIVGAQDLTAISGNTIDYRVGVGSCDKDIVPLVWESPDIIVIGGKTAPPAEGACTQQLILHPVKVTLAAPVGDRVILDISGTPPALLPQ